MSASIQRWSGALLTAPLVMVIAGCSTTLGDVPLPGTGVSGETIVVRAEFADALNLAQGATVKINGVTSGKVQGVRVDDFAAQAEMLVQENAELREGATARLRYTTPLGELFVDVTNPNRGPVLSDGSLLELTATSTAPTIEDTLAQASLLINGGGLDQLQTVTEELNTVLGGREATVRSLLEGSADFLTEANATTADVDATLQALSSVATTLQKRENSINRALVEIKPAAKVLRVNTPGLTELLGELERFSRQADRTVQATRQQLLSIADQARPVLAEFTRNRASYAPSLRQLISLGDTVEEIVPGDFAAIKLSLRLDQLSLPELSGLLDSLGLSELTDLLGGLGLPVVSELPELLGLRGLLKETP